MKSKHYCSDKRKALHKKRKPIYTQNLYHNTNNTTPTKNIIKEGVINLSGKELDENKGQLLNSASKFVSAYNRKLLYIIKQTTEIWALESENDGYFGNVERLRQSVSKTPAKDINKEQWSNLTIRQWNSIREIKNDAKLKVFVIMKEEGAIKRIEEQIGKSNMIDYDPTTTLLNKFQKKLADKEKKESLITRHITKVIHRVQCHHNSMGL